MTCPLRTLDEIFEIARGGSPRPIDQFITDADDGVNWIMISDASNSSKYIRETKKKIRSSGLSRSRLVKPGDFLLTNSMSFGRPYILDTHGCIHDGWLVLSPRCANVDQDYFYHLLGSPAIYGQFDKLAAGATVKNLNIDLVKSVVVPLPPLEEQKRIAAILDQADELRRKRQRALDRLNQLGQAIFIEMFGDPAINPMRWPKVPLADCCAEPDDIRCGPFGTQLLREEFQETGVPLWGIKQVNKAFSIPTHEYVTQSKSKELSNYDIVADDIVMTRKGTIGNCAVYPEHFPPGVMHSDLLRVRLDRAKAAPQFVADQLHYSRDVERQIELISGGAIMQGINVGKLKRVGVLLPPLSLQARYSARITEVGLQVSAMKGWLARGEALFASLQHRAFRGELAASSMAEVAA